MEREQSISLFTQIKEYFYRSRWIIVLIGLAAFITHGSILFSQRFGIDTELMMANIHADFLGRPGLVWLEKLLGLKWFNLYYAQILTLLFLALTPVAFGLLFYLLNSQSPRFCLALLLSGISFIVSPFLVSQIYFICQSAQIILACALIPAALFLVEFSVKNPARRWFCALSAVLLMNIIFGCYQVLVIAYLTGAAAVFIIVSLKDGLSLRQQFRWIAVHAGCFLAGFVSYLVIASLFYQEGGDYLSNQIAWNQLSLSEGIQRCILAVKSTLTTHPPYYSGGYAFFSLLFLGVIIYRLLPVQAYPLDSSPAERKKGGKILVLLAGFLLTLSPYIFMIFLGGELLDRIQLVMPFAQGCMIYLIITLFPSMAEQKKAFLKMAVGIVGTAFAILFFKDATFQLKSCSRLYYTDEWVFQYDIKIAEKVYLDLQEVIASNHLDDSFDNYLLLGSPEIPYNTSTMMGHTMGYSFFRFEADSFQRLRPFTFMRLMGYPVTSAFTEGEKNAYYAYFEEYFGEKVDAMPSYPVSGYIQYLSDDEIGLDYVIIKLGDSWRF